MKGRQTMKPLILSLLGLVLAVSAAQASGPYFQHQAVGCISDNMLAQFETAVEDGDADAAIGRLDAGCFLLLRQDFLILEKQESASLVRVTFNAGELNLLVPNRYLEREQQ